MIIIVVRVHSFLLITIITSTIIIITIILVIVPGIIVMRSCLQAPMSAGLWAANQVQASLGPSLNSPKP